MPSPLEKTSIILGVTGSIASYKAVDLASKLTQAGAVVDVVMTSEAVNFVTPLAFQSITHRSVVTELFNPTSEIGIDHVALAKRADAVVVAPATANTIAKMAFGMADDALTATILATQAPVMVCPAMDGHMYENAATQSNIKVLKDRDVTVVGPVDGYLASGLTGKGRMADQDEIEGHLKQLLGRNGDLRARRIVVTAGGTQEAIDPVRFISNRSSGKMGYAIAEAARDRGAVVVIVAAPNSLQDPVGVNVVPTVSAKEMKSALEAEVENADVLIMAAAVADWRPKTFAHQKIKKASGSDTWAVQLVKTQDAVAGVKRNGLIKIGFAAETEDVVRNAKSKITAKNLDLIVANDITDPDGGFGSATSQVTMLDRNGHSEDLPLLSKYEVGHRILDRVAILLKP
ncbi:MAG: bifunctional phosphopantothenoylcysteine decarboxylase/phosphopantothenate--cysteine ligase CoaBC [SAR202 cluster bacterium]|jgi:phosphopantothenoylcysteine decarboxylase/phosphopantothenate--cysteine ligase|nr:bifunctional phosphopantothenoylcysteine decarboxylase/phosphopantothenate--cysteine ligase CoaBC [SAR202 cluster bacterium]